MTRTATAGQRLLERYAHLDYDTEAADYDAARGGIARARAAATALHAILPGTGVVLDLGIGTGIVAAELRSLGHTVIGVDVSAGMLAQASVRLPGAVLRADAVRLPVRDSSVDAVTAVWFLHLLADVEPVIAEVARVLRPGGWLVSTSDKAAATRLATGREPQYRADGCAHLTALAAGHGMQLAAATSFAGEGQAGTPLYPVLGFRRGTDATEAECSSQEKP